MMLRWHLLYRANLAKMVVMKLWKNLIDLAMRTGQPDPDNPGRDMEFTLAVIGLGAKLAKADGVVTADENVAFHQVFHAEGADLRRTGRAFDRASQTTLGFEGYARRLVRRWRDHPRLLEDVLDGLFHIAAADGVISPDEVDYLRAVADIFGIGEAEFSRIAASWGGPGEDDPYLILGVDRSVSNEELRRAYRTLAAANHPDVFSARGLPRGAERLATEKMAAINAAYQAVRAQRGMAA